MCIYVSMCVLYICQAEFLSQTELLFANTVYKVKEKLRMTDLSIQSFIKE